MSEGQGARAHGPLDPDYAAFDFIYLSLGAGVQSTALYLLSCENRRGVPRADVAIFADTQDEPPWVYENLVRLRAWADVHGGVRIETVTAGRISEHIVERRGNSSGQRFASIPAFTEGDDGRAAPLRRQCTREYKITPIERRARKLMGYGPRQRIPENAACALVGISVDEIQRVKANRTRWVQTAFPLVEARLTRLDCMAVIREAGLPVPEKSSCVFCPYHSDAFWKNLRDNHPEEFKEACRVDRAIRNLSKAGVKRPAYIHRSLVPLSEVEFDETGKLFDTEHGNCDGYCDT